MKKFFKHMFRFIKMTFSLVRTIMVIGMVLIGLGSVYLIYTAYHVTVSQYNESLTWEKTAYDAPLAEVEPVLVSNVVDANKVTAAESWNTLDEYLNTLNGENLDKKKADEVMKEAKHWQEVYNLDSDSITRLSLYLQIEDAIPEAYSTLNTDNLAKLTLQLHNLELEKTTKSGQRYMKRITDVVKDFMTAKSTVTDTILSVGMLENGVWTIPYTYTRSDLADILKQIQAMRKFPALGDTANVLTDIASALNFNKNAREYFAYQKLKESLDSITRSDYIAVSSIYTYEQALDSGIDVSVKQKKGYIISMDSVVTGIYYDGVQLEDDMYIRRGAKVTAFIDPVYEPEETQMIESQLDSDDDEEDNPSETPPDSEPVYEEPQEEEQIPEITPEPQIDNTTQTEQEGEQNEQGQ